MKDERPVAADYYWPWIGILLCLALISPLIWVQVAAGHWLGLILPVLFGSVWAGVSNLVTWLSSPPGGETR